MMFEYAFIIAGGQGKRLQPLTYSIPKPLLPVGDKPIVEFIIDQIKRHDIKNIFISVNYKKELIKNFLRDGLRYGVNIFYIEEEDKSGTAGSLAYLPDDFDGDLLLTNADIISDINYYNIYNLLKKCDFVITGIRKKMLIDFGVLEINKNSELQTWKEKPCEEYLINGGVYAISKKLIPYIKNKIIKGTYCDMPEIWSALQNDGMKIMVYIHDGEWQDVGRIEDYYSLNEKSGV